MTAMRGWWRRWSAKRRAKHESPIPAHEFEQLRRKAWRLVAASKKAKS